MGRRMCSKVLNVQGRTNTVWWWQACHCVVLSLEMGPVSFFIKQWRVARYRGHI